MEKLWTAAEAARWLGITEQEVEGFVRQGKLTGYQLGGRYLRVRPDEVKGLRGNVRASPTPARTSRGAAGAWRERLRQFVYFYDFYIVSAALLAALVVYLVAAG